MKMTKRKLWRAGAVAAALCLAFTGGVYAKDTLERVDAYLRPDFKVEINGKTAKEATPLIYEGASYLPFRMIGELLGAVVSWDEDKKTIRMAMPVYPQPDANGGGNGTGGTGGSGSGQSGAVQGDGGSKKPITPPDVEVPEEITLESPIRHNFVHKGVVYPTLANVYKGTVYLRWKDIKDIPVDVGYPELSKEKLTEDLYVHIDLVRPFWEEEGVIGEFREYAIVEKGTNISEAKLKALNNYFGKYELGLAVKADDKEDVYEVLAQGADKWFMVYTLRLHQMYNGEWTASSTGWKSFPKETETFRP